jgi:hypothetical protein
MINGSKRNTGFIALHRSIQEHWVWEDPLKLKWWLDIIMTVNHTDAKVNIGFKLMDCKRGQSLNSLQTWAKRWRVDVSTVRRFLKLLQNDQMIITENVLKTTRITVCNYDGYNNGRQVKQSQSNSETTLEQSQSNTNKNEEEEINNEKECESEAPTHICEEMKVFADYQDWMGKHAPRVTQMKEPFTATEFLSFTKQFPAPAGEKLFKKALWSLNNYEKLHKRRSAFRTILWWIENEKFDNEIMSLRESCRRTLANDRIPSNEEKLHSLYRPSIAEIAGEKIIESVNGTKKQMQY